MASRRILITGCNGFTGRHLVARLHGERASAIIGLDVAPQPTGTMDEYLQCDLTNPDSVDRAVGRARPDVVFHLAGLLKAASENEFRRTNVGGFVNLRRALIRYGGKRPVRVVTIGSAAEIGSAGAERLPVPDDVPCSPETPYGRSKWEVTQLALAEPADGPLQITVARPFNLVGPGLNSGLSLGSFARQIAAVALGQNDAVYCGTLEGRRDFLDVRDAVEAYVALAERGRAGRIYNVCQGRSYRIGDLLRTLIELSGREVPVQSDPARHPLGAPDIYGDNTRLKQDTGWEPKAHLEQSLRDLLASATNELRKVSGHASVGEASPKATAVRFGFTT